MCVGTWDAVRISREGDSVVQRQFFCKENRSENSPTQDGVRRKALQYFILTLVPFFCKALPDQFLKMKKPKCCPVWAWYLAQTWDVSAVVSCARATNTIASLSPLRSEVCIPLQKHLSPPWLLMEGAKGNKLPSPDTSDMCEDGWVECRPKIFYIFTVVSQPWHYQMIFQSTWKQEEKNLR